MQQVATKTVGLDLGDKHCQLCVLDGKGEVVEESRIRTRPESLALYFQARRGMRVVLEVGTHSRWASKLIQEAGHEVIVANPRRVRLISENQRKSDAVDAELLARLGRVDPKLLAPVEHRNEERHRDLLLVRARAAAVRARTKLVNAVRGLIKPLGIRLPSCSTGRFSKLTDQVPAEYRTALAPLMETIGTLTKTIRGYDAQVMAKAKERPETAPLMQISGVGPLVALTFVSTLQDPQRFRSPRAVGAFLGLTCGRRQSGDSEPHMRITKTGDRYLRSLLVQSAHYILGGRGPDSALKRWGTALVERGGKNGKKRAVVALARKLSVVLYRLWSTGQDYRAFPNLPSEGARQAA